MKLRLFFPSALLVSVVAACSGATGTDLFGPSNSSAPTQPAPADGEPTPSNGSSSGPSDAGSSGSRGSPPPSSSGSSGGQKDAGKDSAPPPPPTSFVACGAGSSCTVGSQVCCASFGGWDNDAPTFECKPSGGLFPCPGASKIACDDRTDCPSGQVCCGTFEETTGRGAAECRTNCKALPGLRAGILCDPFAAVDECATLNKVCAPSQTLPGYFVCKD